MTDARRYVATSPAEDLIDPLAAGIDAEYATTAYRCGCGWTGTGADAPEERCPGCGAAEIVPAKEG